MDKQAYLAGVEYAFNPSAEAFKTRFLRDGRVIYSNESGERTKIDPLTHFHKLSTRKKELTGDEQAQLEAKRIEAYHLGNLAGTGLGLAGTGLVMGGHALERKMTPKVMMKKQMESTLRKAMEVPRDVRVYRSLLNPLKAHFHPSKEVVRIAPKTAPGILAHELGHASGRMINIPYSRMIGAASVPLSIMAQLYTDPESDATKALQYGPLALNAPTLAEEARASIRAVRGLSRAAGGAAALRSLLSLVPAFGTYGLMAASPLIIGKLMHSYIHPES